MAIHALQSLRIQTAIEARHSEQRSAAQQMFRCAKFQCREAKQMVARAHRMFAAAQLIRENMKRYPRLAFSV